jgi:major membrane immunogen (membrane-anchored lipoprotein)
VFATTLKDFRALADVLAKVSESGRVSVVTSPDHAEEANKELAKPLTITPVL